MQSSHGEPVNRCHIKIDSISLGKRTVVSFLFLFFSSSSSSSFFNDGESLRVSKQQNIIRFKVKQ